MRVCVMFTVSCAKIPWLIQAESREEKTYMWNHFWEYSVHVEMISSFDWAYADSEGKKSMEHYLKGHTNKMDFLCISVWHRSLTYSNSWNFIRFWLRICEIFVIENQLPAITDAGSCLVPKIGDVGSRQE